MSIFKLIPRALWMLTLRTPRTSLPHHHYLLDLAPPKYSARQLLG
jgi:hypothetical protein